MNKKTLWMLPLSLLITIPIIGFAEDFGISSSVTNSDDNAKVIKIGVKEKNGKEKEDLHDKTRDIRTNSSLSIEEKKTEIESAWSDKKNELSKIREERETKIQEIKINTQKIIFEKREAIRSQLGKINDKRKTQIVENTDRKLEKISETRTNHLFNVLNDLEKVLAKINVRIDAAQERGVDVSSAKKAADDAGKAIVAARAAVEAQVGKVYKMTITEESKLKNDVEKTARNLQNDLKQVRIIVQSAHDAVRKAAVALARALGFEYKPKSSSSSSVSSSSLSVSSSSSVSSDSSPVSSSSSVTSSSSFTVSSESSSSIASSSSLSPEASSSQSSQ